MKKVNLQLFAYIAIVVLLAANISMILRPMFSSTMSAVFIGEIDGQFARLTLDRDGTCDYYSMADGDRLYGGYISGIVRAPDKAGVIVMDDGHKFSFDTVFSSVPESGDGRLYNIRAITLQAVLAIGYITCIYFGFMRDKLRRRKLKKYYIK